MGFAFQCYRILIKTGSRLFFKRRLQESLSSLKKPVLKVQKKRIWFHAASTGELEALTPLICHWAEKAQCRISLLSPSGLSSLTKLAPQAYDFGLSPLEGHWQEALKEFDPDLFVTYKYEAWPDLWGSLHDLQIPLLMVSGQVRKSLLVVSRFLACLFQPLPSLLFTTVFPEEVAPLQKAFPHSQIQVVGEPRWDRVFQRREQAKKQTLEVPPAFFQSSQRILILGSVWLKDLAFLFPSLLEWPGVFWLVPHCVDEPSLRAFELFLNQHQLSFVRTSQCNGQPALLAQNRFWLIDEMGRLAELYRFAEAAYVGGGWGAGIHNVIEPALYGIPIAVGPKKGENFSEVKVLMRSGQLQILESKKDLEAWIQILKNPIPFQKEKWIHLGEENRGATQEIAHWMEKLL